MSPSISRRELLRLASAGVVVALNPELLEQYAWGQSVQSGPSGVITAENAKAGSPNWQLDNPATNREIEGYASLTSVNRGGQISFYVNTADSTYTLEVYRIGWYGGAGGRLLFGPVQLAGVRQPMPAADSFGMIECRWTNPYTLSIPYNPSDPTDWCSGVYLVKLTGNTSGKQAYIPFVVRDDARSTDFLFNRSVSTDQAYNNWGGKSLYDYNSTGGKANKVSYNRPDADEYGAGDFLAWEVNMVRFLEREGFDVSYCTNIDVHENGNILLNHKAFLSVGHNEYWSWEMRQNVTAARDAGVSLGFFSANTCYWQIRLEPSPVTGAKDRTQVCYKGYPDSNVSAGTLDPYYLDSDPTNDYLITVLWRNTLDGSQRHPLPEDALIGVAYGSNPVDADMVIVNAGHWICAGTGLINGSVLYGLVGYEYDSLQNNTPPGTTLIAHSPLSSTYSDSTVYTAASGAIVYATGSIQWAWGLDDYSPPYGWTDYHSARVAPEAQQMARNILCAFTTRQVTGSSAPVARPGGPYNGAGGLVQFNASGSLDPGGSITTYQWDFGDGTTGTGVNPVHRYTAPGYYLVRLVVTDNRGLAASGLASVHAHDIQAFKSVTADSVYDVTDTSGTRYYYPPSGVGDGVVPVPTDADVFNQWFSAANLDMDANGVLTTPVNLYITLWQPQSVSRVRLYQASFYDPSAFHARDFLLFLRLGNGAWQQVASGTLADANGQPLDIAVGSMYADQARIQILSTYDTYDYFAVGLAEVQINP